MFVKAHHRISIILQNLKMEVQLTVNMDQENKAGLAKEKYKHQLHGYHII